MGAAITGKQAWAIMVAGIIAYEFSCDEDELLSVVVDGWLLSHPILTRVIIGSVSLHLLNAVPPVLDPLTIGFFVTRRAREWCSKRFA